MASMISTWIAVKCYMAHIVPGFVCIINTWLTNSKLSKKFLPGLIFFGLIYAIVNFYMTKKTGKPIYPFLTWEGPDSLLIIAAMIAVFFQCYGVYVFSVLYKPRSFSRRASPQQQSDILASCRRARRPLHPIHWCAVPFTFPIPPALILAAFSAREQPPLAWGEGEG